MNEVNLPHGEELTVLINGEKLPLVESVTEELEAELAPVRSFGENEPRDFYEAGRRYVLKLTRIPVVALPERFTLTLDDGDALRRYSDCRCLRSERINRAAEPVKELCTLVSARREDDA